MPKMADKEIEAALSALPEWTVVGEAIQRTYHFPDFVAAMKFVNAIADSAERDQHHPDILIRYNKVTLTLATHDAGGVTEKDFKLAITADGLFSPAAPPAAAAVAPRRRAKS